MLGSVCESGHESGTEPSQIHWYQRTPCASEMCLWLMFKLLQIKGYFSFSTVMSPKGGISVIFSSFELLELSLSLRVTRGSNSAFHILKRQEASLEDLGDLTFQVHWTYSSVLQYFFFLFLFFLNPVRAVWRGWGWRSVASTMSCCVYESALQSMHLRGVCSDQSFSSSIVLPVDT